MNSEARAAAAAAVAFYESIAQKDPRHYDLSPVLCGRADKIDRVRLADTFGPDWESLATEKACKMCGATVITIFKNTRFAVCHECGPSVLEMLRAKDAPS